MSVTTRALTGNKEKVATMMAMVVRRYGSPDVMELREIERPALDPDSVLVHVRAASINAKEVHELHGSIIVRLSAGLRRPKKPVLGADMAGVVEAVGGNVTGCRPGDEVFGTCGATGTLAEYARGAKNLVPKPANLTFEQAAAIPIAGITALQGLRDRSHLQPGQTVLINGASGGVGTFAVQIAKALGAEVTGVCSTRNVELVRSIGADHVIDYTQEDFVRRGQQYDVVLDVVGNRSLSDLRRVTKPHGVLLPIGGKHDRGHGARGLVRPLLFMARGLVVSRFVSQNIRFYMAQINRDDLFALKALCEEGKVTPVIDRTYPLADAAAAMRYLETGHARAKVIVTA